MTIFLTGGTGYIGSAVLEQLIRSGHEVVALVRSEASASQVSRKGAIPLRGDITDKDWLSAQLKGVDGAIHLALPGDETSPQVDLSVVEAAIAAFGGTRRPFVHTSGVWIYGEGNDITENSPLAPPALVAWRVPLGQALLDSDVVATIVVPAVVFGYGTGIPAMLPAAPRSESGELTVIGDGSQHWATVHVDDLAALYIRALESGQSHGYVLGASGDNPTLTELGEAITRGPVAPETAEKSRGRLGAAFADALLLDQQATGAKARSLGWIPNGPRLVDELRRGSYAQ